MGRPLSVRNLWRASSFAPILRVAVRLCSCAVLLLAPLPATLASSSTFDPYQLNGGLVAAVAGHDYTIVATDTRLTEGYEILSRNHLSSRLWSPWPLPVVVRVQTKKNHHQGANNHDSTDDTDTESDDTAPFLPDDALIDEDGSLRLPQPAREGDAPPFRHASCSPVFECVPTATAAYSSSSGTTTTTSSLPPLFIGSAGCQADCEQLKRVLRSDLRQARYFGTFVPSTASLASSSSSSLASSSTTTSHRVATLLSQLLYSRRGFPYYSFCVLASVDGGVYVYDAIGSYEQVAVATAGTGRELLQPILDRLFESTLTIIPTPATAATTTTTTTTATSLTTAAANAATEAELDQDGRNPERSEATVAPSLSTAPFTTTLGPYGIQKQRRHATQVACSPKEAIDILRRAYEAVAEREIAVGDQIVLCVMRRQRRRSRRTSPDDDAGCDGGRDQGRGDEGGTAYTCQVLTFPLKQH